MMGWRMDSPRTLRTTGRRHRGPESEESVTEIWFPVRMKKLS